MALSHHDVIEFVQAVHQPQPSLNIAKSPDIHAGADEQFDRACSLCPILLIHAANAETFACGAQALQSYKTRNEFLQERLDETVQNLASSQVSKPHEGGLEDVSLSVCGHGCAQAALYNFLAAIARMFKSDFCSRIRLTLRLGACNHIVKPC